MNLLQDIITYVRRIIKSPSNAVITDSLIIDYINRFWIMDVDARIQLFDLKKVYQFQTIPGFDQYNMPLYDIQTEEGMQSINFYPVYQVLQGPAYINGIQVQLQTQRSVFYNAYPKVVQQVVQVGTGNGTTGPYNLSFPIQPANSSPLNPPIQYILRGHVDMQGIISTGANEDPPLVTALEIINNQTFIQDIPVTNVFPAVYITSTASDGSNIIVCDSGQFLDGNLNYGLLMEQGKAPNGNLPLTNGPGANYTTTQNTINYFDGTIQNLFFPVAVPNGAQINAQFYFFQSGLPRGILVYDNIITLRSPPDRQYLVEIEVYMTPAAFLTGSNAIPFAYMSEYMARGAARKILADTGDVEQFNFYEPFFKEQEMLVWKRSQRQFTATRTQTIYSNPGILSGYQSFSGQ